MKKQKCNSFRAQFEHSLCKGWQSTAHWSCYSDAFWVTDNTQCGSLEIGLFVCVCVFGCQLCDGLPQSLTVCAISVRYESTRNHIIASHSLI
jgi:hypothetical protein